MLSKRSLESIIPQEMSLADTLRRLAEELNHCSHTLRETHSLVAPQLDELEKLYPKALATPGDDLQPDPRREPPRDPGKALKPSYDQRSLGRTQSRGSA